MSDNSDSDGDADLMFLAAQQGNQSHSALSESDEEEAPKKKGKAAKPASAKKAVPAKKAVVAKKKPAAPVEEDEEEAPKPAKKAAVGLSFFPCSFAVSSRSSREQPRRS